MAYVPLDYSSIGYFSSVEGFTVFPTLDDAIKNLNVLDDEKILSNIFDEYGSNVIPYSFYSSAPELTGGLKTGNLAQSLEEIEDTNEVKSSNIGVLSLVKADSLAYSVLNALGINVTPNDTIKEKVATALSTIYNKVITATAINTFSIPIIVKNGLTYIPQTLVKKLSDTLFNEGLFTKTSTVENFPYTDYVTLKAPTERVTLSSFVDKVSREIIDFANHTGSSSSFRALVGSGKLTQGLTTLYNSISNIYAFTLFLNESERRIDVIYIFNPSQETKQYPSQQDGFGNLYSDGSAWASTKRITFGIGNDGIYFNTPTNVGGSGNMTCIVGKYLIKNSVGDASRGYYGNFLGEKEAFITGIDEQIGANTPKDNDIDIQTKYANWSNTAVDIGFYNPTIDSIANGKLLPIDLQGEKDATLSTTWDKAQADAWAGDIADDVNARDKITEGVNDAVNDLVNAETGSKVEAPSTPVPPNPPTPTPSVITSVTSAGLATIYNPTESQVQALKGELWQESVLDILKTLFANNPLDCIISLHRIYCTPSTSGTATIKLGYYQSSVSGVKIINNQYVTIDCGTVNVPEIYGNATDYLPYTNISIYLPFIGIRDLSANDIVGGSVNVIYRIDVTTGVCLAQIDVTKNGIKQTLYAFDGNCAVTVPLSSANMLRLLGGMTTAITGAVTGNVLGTVAGLGASLGGISVQKSGNFSSNAGAMGIKKPYLIINRHIPYDASEYNKLHGYPSNKLVKLSTLNGFTRVKYVHVEGIACTDNEKILIENALKEGVFL